MSSLYTDTLILVVAWSPGDALSLPPTRFIHKL